MSDRAFHERYAEFYAARYGDFVRAVDVSGPVTLIDAWQGSGNLSGTSTNEVLFVRTMSRAVHAVDFGDGLRREFWNPDNFAVCPAHFHNRVVSEEPHRIQIVAIHLPALRTLLAASHVHSDGDFAQLHSRQASDPAFARLWSGLYRNKDAGGLAHESGVLELCLHALSLSGRRRQAPRPSRERMSRRALRLVMDRLAAVDLPCPQLSELAQLTGLSAHHVCRAFKAETGMPPHRFHLVHRIEKARTLLEAGTLPISEIAASLGFYDHSYFSRRFLKETGFSPSAWRSGEAYAGLHGLAPSRATMRRQPEGAQER